MREKKKKFKRLFFDIETSPNLGWFWRAGYKEVISHQQIIEERKIICISWKWQGEKKVHNLDWGLNKQCDKAMLLKFMKVMEEADEVVGHNSDKFDIKWLRTRCLFHRIPALNDYRSFDTIKAARQAFNFNSNRLDYISKFLGSSGKMETGGIDLWLKIWREKDAKSLVKMKKYCDKDVIELETVFTEIEPYTKHKSHVGVVEGRTRCSCAKCGSENTIGRGSEITAGGLRQKRINCKDCGGVTRVPMSVWNKRQKERGKPIDP